MREWIRKSAWFFVAAVGYVLSPLSWWNDLYVNIPIAYLFASFVPHNHPRTFTLVFAGAYWFTNVLGLLLLQTGGTGALSKVSARLDKHSTFTWLAWSLLYTLVIVLLCQLGLVRPLPEYF